MPGFGLLAIIKLVSGPVTWLRSPFIKQSKQITRLDHPTEHLERKSSSESRQPALYCIVLAGFLHLPNQSVLSLLKSKAKETIT